MQANMIEISKLKNAFVVINIYSRYLKIINGAQNLF